MRIISICPSNTEIIALLGLTDSLIAVDDFSDWPLAVQSLPKLGPDLSIDLDAIEALQPDLVLSSLSVPGMEKNVEGLKARNIPQLILNANSLDEIIEEVRLVGKACQVEKHAEKVATAFKEKRNELHTIAQSLKTSPSLYWEWWPNPIFTPGKVNWLTEISRLAGGQNAFDDVALASVMTDIDDVRRRNPDYIFLSWVGVAYDRINTKVVQKRDGWIEMDALKNGRIYKMEEWLYCRPSPRLLIGAIQLAKRIHPDEYAHVEIPSFLIFDDTI